MIFVLLCALLSLTLAVVSLVRFQQSSTPTGRIATGIAAMVTGVLGLVLLAAVTFGQS